MTADYHSAAPFPSSTLHEASGGLGALPSAIKPIQPSMRLCGRALTIQCGAGDNLWIHRALLLAEPGDVLVCSVSDAYEHGYWGEILTVAAIAKNVVGLVIDGCVRDADQIVGLRFPVFARGLCIRGTSKPIVIGSTTIRTGDLVVADSDGVLVLSPEVIADTVERSKAREAKEAQIMAQLRAGHTTMALYGW